MKSEIPLQSQQSCLLTSTFEVFPPLLEPAMEAKLVCCQIHNPIKRQKQILKNLLCVFFFFFSRLLDYRGLKRGSLQLLRNVSRLIITWSVHFIFGTSRQEFVSSLETSDTLLPMEQSRRERETQRDTERERERESKTIMNVLQNIPQTVTGSRPERLIQMIAWNHVESIYNLQAEATTSVRSPGLSPVSWRERCTVWARGQLCVCSRLWLVQRSPRNHLSFALWATSKLSGPENHLMTDVEQ